MIYLKYFEELELTNRKIQYEKINDTVYQFTTDELIYQVAFTPSLTKKYKSCWERGYDLLHNQDIDYYKFYLNFYPFKDKILYGKFKYILSSGYQNSCQNN